MTLIEGMRASTELLVQIANPAVRALPLAGAAGLGLAIFRVKTTSARLSTWRVVLYAALALPLLGWLLPPLAIPVPALVQSPNVQDAVTQDAAPGVLAARTAATTPISVSISTSTAESKVSVSRHARKRIAVDGIGERTFSSSASQVTNRLPIASATVPASPSFFRSIRWSTIPWAAGAIAIYLAVALLLFVRFVIGLVLGRRLVRAAWRIDDARLSQTVASRAQSFGLAIIPQVAESELISVPVTMGALRSTVLLPVTWREWDAAKLDAIIAHEVSHVARRDGLTQRLSLLHRAIFWFSPLAWWLDRQLADLAEQASDEAALSGGADRNDYARILLGFFQALQASPGRVRWQGVAMAKLSVRHTGRQAEQRVERILSWRGSAMNAMKSKVKKSVAVAAVGLAIPVVYVAASVRPMGNAAPTPQYMHFAQQQANAPSSTAASTTGVPSTDAPSTEAPSPDPEMTPPASPGPAEAPAPVAIAGSVKGGVSIVAIPPRPPMAYGAPIAPAPRGAGAYPPMAALAPVAPAVAWGRQSSGSGSSNSSGSSHGRGYSYHYGFDDEQRFVIVSGKTDALTMSGSSEDARHVEKLRKSIQGDFIWFERDEKPYIIRDQATIDRARKFWEGEEELGKKQEALGVQQEALGKQQEALGEKMEQVQINVPDMTAELDKLKAKLQKLGSHATMEQIGDLQSEIGDLQSKIGELQGQAGEAQGKLGEEQGALGEKQGKLGEEQGRLGEQQARLAHEATVKMKQLLDEAIKSGTAQPEL